MNPGISAPGQCPTIGCVVYPTHNMGHCAHTGNTATICTQQTCIPHTGVGIATVCPPADGGAQAQITIQPTTYTQFSCGYTGPINGTVVCPPPAHGGHGGAYTGNAATICTQIGCPSPGGGAQAQTVMPPTTQHTLGFTCTYIHCQPGGGYTGSTATICTHFGCPPPNGGAQAQPQQTPNAGNQVPTTLYTHFVVQCCTGGTTLGPAPAQAQNANNVPPAAANQGGNVSAPPHCPMPPTHLLGCTTVTSTPDQNQAQVPASMLGCTTVTSTPTQLLGCTTATTPPTGHYTFNFPGCTTVTSAPNQAQAQMAPTQLMGCTTVTSTPPTHLMGCTTVTSTPTGHYTFNFPGCTTVTSTPPAQGQGGYTQLLGCTTVTSTPTHLLGCTTVTSNPNQAQAQGAPTQLLGCTTVTSTPTHFPGCTTVTSTPTQLLGCTTATTPPAQGQAQPATALPFTTVCLPPSITCPPAAGGAANAAAPAPAAAQAAGTMSFISPTACVVTQVAGCGGVTGIPLVC